MMYKPEAHSAPSEQERVASEYWLLIEEANELSATLTTAMLRATFNSEDLDREHAISLKCALMTTLTAKASLHMLLSGHDESRKMSFDTACQIVSITDQLQDGG
jgi:hypothetical protein